MEKWYNFLMLPLCLTPMPFLGGSNNFLFEESPARASLIRYSDKTETPPVCCEMFKHAISCQLSISGQTGTDGELGTIIDGLLGDAFRISDIGNHKPS